MCKSTVFQRSDHQKHVLKLSFFRKYDKTFRIIDILFYKSLKTCRSIYISVRKYVKARRKTDIVFYKYVKTHRTNYIYVRKHVKTCRTSGISLYKCVKTCRTLDNCVRKYVKASRKIDMCSAHLSKHVVKSFLQICQNTSASYQACKVAS